MCAKARLAASEFDKNTNVSVRRSIELPGSTLHCHDFYELEIIIGGNSETLLNGKHYDVNEGVVFFLSPADFHEYSLCKKLDLYNIQFTNEAISSEILERTVSHAKNMYHPDKQHFDEIVNLVSVMSNLAQDKSCADIQTRILESIMLILIKDEESKSSSSDLIEGYERDMQKAVMYIHAHFKENPSLVEVAETIPLNPRYFCTKFKKYTGKSYKQYLRQTKLRYARKLIVATSLSMIDESFICSPDVFCPIGTKAFAGL